MTQQPTSRQRLVDAVGPAIVRHGLDGLTVQQVLDAADVSRRTYYKHFRGLPGLLSVAYDLCCDHVEQQIIEAVAPADGLRDKAIAGVDRWVDLVTDPRWWFLPLHTAAAQPGSPMHPRREQLFARGVSLMDRAVRHRTGRTLDPYIYWAVVLGSNGLLRHVASAGEITQCERKRLQDAVAALYLGGFST